jgi:hypothetical protein
MKVRELVEALSKCDQECEIFISDYPHSDVRISYKIYSIVERKSVYSTASSIPKSLDIWIKKGE